MPDRAFKDITAAVRRIGTELQRIREADRVSIDAVAKRAGMLPTTVAAVEAGRDDLPIYIPARVADTLGVRFRPSRDLTLANTSRATDPVLRELDNVLSDLEVLSVRIDDLPDGSEQDGWAKAIDAVRGQVTERMARRIDGGDH